MNRKTMLAAIAGVMFGVLSAGATLYQDFDSINEKLTHGWNESHSGYFDIVNAGTGATIGTPYYATPQAFNDIGGYVLGTDISSADVYFYLRDDSTSGSDGAETVKITISEIRPWWEQEDTLQTFTTLGVFGGTANISVLTELESTGHLRYTVTATCGDFYFDYAGLQVNTVNPAGVPDAGASVSLLGLAMLSLGAFRRKLSI